MIDITAISNHLSTSVRQIVFIDDRVENYQDLVAGIVSNIEIVILDRDRNGIEQITKILSQRNNFTSIHIVSHGSPGCLYLGNTQLSLDTLATYQKYLKIWFSSSPTLLLYGCNVAAGDAGAEFITKLHNITGAEIAASTTPIGNADLGGNWELDITTNAIDTTLAFTEETQQSYSGIFAVTTSGNVFVDYNNDGTQQPTNDSEEVGYEGITVIAYDASNNIVAQTTTSPDGSYSLTTPDNTPLRIEFGGLPEGFLGSSIAGTDSVSDLFFIDGTTNTTANLGIHRPHEVTTGDSADIDLITVCYVEGIGNGASAIIIHDYDAAGSDSSTPNAPGYNQLVTYDQIGSVNGLAYHRQSSTLFAGSYYKRHSALLGTVDFINNGNANDSSNDASGVAYTSVLYSVDDTGNVTEFARLDDVLDPRGAVTDSSQTYWEIDNGADGTKGNEVFDAVGKTGLGDVELSEDGQTLWTVNLNDNQLYRLPVKDPNNPSPPTASEIDSFDIIANILNSGGDLGVNPQGNVKPFALSTRDGLVYVGMVNSAQYDANGDEGNTTAADLRAYVYAIDPNNPNAAPSKVLDIPLNYARDQVVRSGNTSIPADWNPWVSEYPNPQVLFGDEVSYPQPILSDIDFDPDGNMILGFRDRFGDQMGNEVQPPEGGSTLQSTSGGDILLAPYDNSNDSWKIETHVTTDGINGANDPDGEFFRNEFLEDNAANDSLQVHAETAQGGLAVVPGFTEVVTTAMDPTDAFQGGFEWFNTDEETGTLAGHFVNEGGLTVSGLEIFDNGDAGTAGKANGLGDLEFISASPLIDVGNRVWFDTDKDGIQDVGESGVPDGVTVELYNSDGSLFGTTTTTNGQYSFSGLSPFTDYEVRLVNADFLAGSDLQGYEPTLAYQGINDELDSNAATKGGSGVPVISFTTGAPGENDFSLDVGLTNNPPTYDYGDATDAASGTGAENYQTTDSDGGARHIIANGLTIGNDVNADDGTLQNTDANADIDNGVTFDETLQIGDGSFTADVDVNLANNISEDFSSDGYTGGIGWLGNWTEADDPRTTGTGETNNDPNAGVVQVIDGRLRIADDTTQIYRQVDMSGATGDATLTFNYSWDSLDNASEQYEVVVSDDVGGTETILFTIDDTTVQGTDAGGSASVNIPQSFLTSTTTITIRKGTSSVNLEPVDFAYFDNFNITAPGVEVPATLVGWIDFNQDGEFTANESVSNTVTTSGTESLTWNTFPDIVEGSTYARFRLSTDDALDTIEDSDSIGELSDGEVEDYRLGVGRDYGDAPDPTTGETTGDYKTTQTDGGASHGIIEGLSIGSNVDPDDGTLQNTSADADDTANEDDEDGVTFATSLSLNDESYTASVDVINTTGQDALLTGWIDFDQSGTFDADERQSIVFSQSGTQNLIWDTIPNDLEEGTTYARFRLSNNFITTPESITVVNSLYAEDFDDTVTGWTVDPNGDDTALADAEGQWVIGEPVAHDRFGDNSNEQLNAYSSPNALITGSGDTNTDVDNSSGASVDGITTVDSADLPTLPITADSIDLSLKYFLSASVANDDNFTIELRRSSDNSLLSTLLSETPTAQQTGTWTDLNASLTSNAGEDTYLRFIATDVGNDSVIEVGVDDIEITFDTTDTEQVPVDLAPDGALETGEVEDYVVNVGLDYGDAPDTTSGTGQGDYQTTKDNGGASHVIVDDLQIGDAVDADSTILQNTEANADDINNTPDDEDGVTFATNLKVDDSSYNATVQVTNNTASDAKLVGWIDFNQDGIFDPSESVVANIPTGNTDTEITLTWDDDPDNDAVNDLIGNGFFGTTILPGTTYARFRLSTDVAFDGDNSLGAATDGEVEDYKLIVGIDYGDARDSDPGTGEGNYNTLATDDGASHIIDSDLSIGYITDADDGEAQNDDATADDGQGIVGQLSYEYYDITPIGTVDSVDDIPNSGANGIGAIDPDGNLVTQVTDVTQSGTLDPNNFGIRYTGSIFIATPGEYTFYTTSDDGSTLSISNTLVVDNDGLHGAVSQSGTYTFDSAGYYPIEVEYFERNGGNSLILEYESATASVTRQNIPASVLSTNDEEGIKSFPTLQSDTTNYSLDVTVGNTTGGAATLVGWIDFDRSGTFDPNEAVTAPVPNNVTGNLGTSVNLDWSSIPIDITSGITSARFRLSTDPDLDINSPTGLLDDGEVEDYQINIVGIDYGDAPDTIAGGANREDAGEYRTTLADEGASHIVVDGLKLGATVDADTGTLQNTAATADDLDNRGDDDDEDGVTFNTISTNNANGTYTVNLDYTNDTGSDANIVGWIDFDQDGVFETGEASNVFTAGSSVFDSNTTLTWNVPAGIKGGTTFARFRISNDTTNLTTAAPTGELTSGEVEDYQIFVDGGTDFGDAAFADSSDSYAATTTSHSIVRGFSLGNAIDDDPTPTANADANADDNTDTDDEDGVTFNSTLKPTDTEYSVEVDVNVITSLTATDDFSSGNLTGGTGWSNNWADADSNSGVFNEQLFSIAPDNEDSVSRQFDFSFASGDATLTFDYSQFGLDAGESYLVQVDDGQGGTPETLLTIDNSTSSSTSTNTSSGNLTISQSLLASGTTTISIVPNVVDQDAQEGVIIDNLSITAPVPTANLIGWVDFNGDGDFDDIGESTSVAVTESGTKTLIWSNLTSVPGGVTTGDTYARFRLSTDPSLTVNTPTGSVNNGEVEDYKIIVAEVDYGDAPDTGTGTGVGNYQTTDDDNGASHVIVSGLSIGTAPDGDSGNLNNTDADDDDSTDTADEDGVTLPNTLSATSTSYSATVNVNTNPGDNANLVGWIDFDGDGEFEPDEASDIITGINTDGDQTLTWSNLDTLPDGITSGTSYVRLRLTTDTLTTSDSTGAASDGEVQDHQITIADVDYGDAPDTGAGTTGTDNYETTDKTGTANDGASHIIVDGLSIGSVVDGDDGTLENTAANADDIDGTVGELNYEYYDLTSPTTVDDIPAIGADATGTVDASLDLIDQADQGDLENFGIRYTGSIFIANPGEYTFYLTSDDGSTLSIENTPVVNNDGVHGGATASGTYTFDAAGYYDLEIEYFEALSPDSLTFEYESTDASIARQNVPAAILSTNDEEGVTLPDNLAANADSYSVTVDVTNTPGSAANLVGWIDFDGDGEFEASEVSNIVSGINTDSTQTLTWSNLQNLPDGINPGTTYARFRYTTDALTDGDSNGVASDGEVEDYQITINAVDYGDAPDTGAGFSAGNYETTDKTGTANDGASHGIVSGLSLGDDIDGDDGTQENTAANDDDSNGDTPDDEDGVTAFSTLNITDTSYSVDIDVTNTTGIAGGANLVGWIDFNGNGQFETGEASNIITGITSTGSQTLTWDNGVNPLPGIEAGSTYVRFRLTTETLTDADSIGAFVDGEVEDYRITILGGQDFGDATNSDTTPTDSYAATTTSHDIVDGLSIGNAIDNDSTPTANADANADDNNGTNDEDGVTFTENLKVTDEDYSVTVDVINTTGSDAELIGWIDFNGNGTFESGEASTPLLISSSGQVTLNWTGITPVAGDTYARFRLNDNPANLDTNTPTGDLTAGLDGGEVEDYKITIAEVDFGDAPDGAASTDAGNYQTINRAGTGDDGASHAVVTGLSIGSVVDGDDGTLENTAANADDIDGTVGELNYEYYDLTSPTTVNDIPAIGADATGTVDASLDLVDEADQGDTDNFGIRYTGSIFIATAGEYTFHLTSDDGSTLSIDNTQVVDNDGTGNTTASGTYTFAAAGHYDLEIEYFEASSPDSLTFEYESTDASITRQNVPAGILSTNDEEGVTLPDTLAANSTSYSVTVDVTNTTGDDANLVGWIDFDGDGEFEADEASNIISGINADGTQTLTWNNLATLPDGMVAGDTYARFRLTTDTLTTADSTGEANDGEVEDHLINIKEVDYGDAPDTGLGTSNNNYETTNKTGTADDGPSHIIVSGLSLGDDVDGDNGTLQNGAADDDDNNGDTPDDEDGVLQFDPFATDANTYSVDVDVINTLGAGANLVGWIDFDRDGIFEPWEASTPITGITDADSTQELTWSGLQSRLGDITSGDTYVRLRLTTDTLTTGDSIGAASDGEVEDYAISIQDIDYGDAPDTGAGTDAGNYETTNKDGIGNDGPSHVIVSGLSIGTAPDGDSGELQNPAADHDDTTDTADEDGVTIPDTLAANSTSYSINVDVTNTTGIAGGANLVGWIDFNGDGNFDASEASAPITGITASGTQTLNWTGLDSLPDGITSGTSYVRLRLTTDTLTTADSTGAANNGEVQDHQITIGAVDYGDAPDTDTSTGAGNYQTTDKTGTANDGPSHVIVSGFSLGDDIDGDSGSLQNGAANDDDNDGTPIDEDGVAGFGTLNTTSTTYSLTVDVTNTPGGSGNLVGWIDFNGNGEFETGEASNIVTGITTTGSQVLTWDNGANPLPGIKSGTTYARFRLTTDTLTTASSTGAASDGEVEDYRIVIEGGQDFGDATNSDTTPTDSYAATTTSHDIVDGLSLGDSVDHDATPTANAAADADDTTDSDDEDGVTFTSVLKNTDTTHSATVDVTNTTGSAAELIGWIDFNGDGDFDDPNEASNVASVTSSGEVTLNWTGISPTVGTTYARFRLNDNIANLDTNTPTGALDGGEVEDYLITIKNDVPGTGASESLTNSTANVNDIFTGGAGQDTITGNGGDDCFHFNRTSDGIDTIIDFNSGDKLDFSDMFATGGELDGVPITTNPFDDGYVIANTVGTGTLVQVDFDLADSVNNKNVVYLENFTGMSASDFIF